MQANGSILITGAGGQVGRALMEALRDSDNVIGWTRNELDMANIAALKVALEETSPSCILNAAAYTAVDKAEEEEELATIINGDAPGLMAEYAAKKNIPLVHYSTDYVFDGSGDQPRREDAPTAPINAYGRGKLAGEQAIAQSGCDHLIFRTSWVYDAWGINFVNTMLRLGAERDELKIVADQIGAPTYAPHLAAATLKCVGKARDMAQFPSGVYHLCNGGETNWREFAQAIFDEARAQGVTLKVREVGANTTANYPTPAKRPLNSRLDMAKLREVFGVSMPDWREGLKECFEVKGEARAVA